MKFCNIEGLGSRFKNDFYKSLVVHTYNNNNNNTFR